MKEVIQEGGRQNVVDRGGQTEGNRQRDVYKGVYRGGYTEGDVQRGVYRGGRRRRNRGGGGGDEQGSLIRIRVRHPRKLSPRRKSRPML